MNTMDIMCFTYTSWKEAHAAHSNDFVVYNFDVLPEDEILAQNTSYIGSAGANSERQKETKTSGKKDYVKGSLGARYRGGSYTKNHTRGQRIDIFCISRNAPDEGEDRSVFLAKVNAPGFKREERNMLGYLEYRLHKLATSLNISLANGEIPKCVKYSEFDSLSDSVFFSTLNFIGTVPPMVQIALGQKTLEQVRQEQREFALSRCSSIINSL